MSKKDKIKINEATINYSGNVTITKVSAKTNKILKRTQKHNEGKAVFFELIVQAIAGIDILSLMPRYLRGYNEDDEIYTTAYTTYNNPVITRSDDTASVSFEFLIPFTQISSTSWTTHLKLFNTTIGDHSVFAEIDLGEDNKFKGEESINYFVIWTITIGNKGE